MTEVYLWRDYRRKGKKIKLHGIAKHHDIIMQLCAKNSFLVYRYTHTHTHTRLTALFPGLPWWAGTRKVKPIWILLEQETVSGSGIGWAICKSAPRSRQITTLAPHYSVFYRLDALPATQPTVSKHWRHLAHWRQFKPLLNNAQKWNLNLTASKSLKSACVCEYYCVQVSLTTQQCRAGLIIFVFCLQTIIRAQWLSIGSYQLRHVWDNLLTDA